MESIYLPKHFKCSERLPLKEYFEEYSTLISNHTSVNEEFTEKEKLSHFLGVNLTDKETEALEKTCSPDKLTILGEFPPAQHTTNVYDVYHKFSQYPILENDLNTAKANENLMGTLKIDQVLYHHNRSDNNQNLTSDYIENITPLKEFVVFIRIYHPFLYVYGQKTRARGPIMKFSHEIAILGSQTLADLRDKIICRNDYGIRTEVDIPDLDMPCHSSVEAYPSGFIFIDETIYNDFRKKDAIDYSEVIRKWAEMKNIGTFKTANMNETRMDSFKPRFGYPYLYQHQGDCEHIVMFVDARLLGNDELRDCKLYPYRSVYTKNYAKECALCGQDIARWICMECDRVPHEKAFLCTECLVSYNYIDGEKVGTFKVYPYFHKPVDSDYEIP